MPILGIDVPLIRVSRVMAAFRATFPDLTGDAQGMTPLADGPAARAVLKHLVRQIVMAYEANQVRETQRNQVTAAEQQAFNDLDDIS